MVVSLKNHCWWETLQLNHHVWLSLEELWVRKYIKSPNNTDPEGYRIRMSLQEIALYNLRRMNKKRATSTVRTYFQTVRFLWMFLLMDFITRFARQVPWGFLENGCIGNAETHVFKKFYQASENIWLHPKIKYLFCLSRPHKIPNFSYLVSDVV